MILKRFVTAAIVLLAVMIGCALVRAQGPSIPRPLAENANISVTSQDITIICAGDRVSQRPANGPGWAPGSTMITIDLSPRAPSKR